MAELQQTKRSRSATVTTVAAVSIAAIGATGLGAFNAGFKRGLERPDEAAEYLDSLARQSPIREVPFVEFAEAPEKYAGSRVRFEAYIEKHGRVQQTPEFLTFDTRASVGPKEGPYLRFGGGAMHPKQLEAQFSSLPDSVPHQLTLAAEFEKKGEQIFALTAGYYQVTGFVVASTSTKFGQDEKVTYVPSAEFVMTEYNYLGQNPPVK